MFLTFIQPRNAYIYFFILITMLMHVDEVSFSIITVHPGPGIWRNKILGAVPYIGHLRTS